MNQGGAPAIDIATQTIRNDDNWKGFFPEGHVLNAMSAAIFTGFRKEFHKQGGKYIGVTSDTDGRIHARNSLEEVEIDVGHDAARSNLGNTFCCAIWIRRGRASTTFSRSSTTIC